MRVAFHGESLNARLRIPMLLVMVDLLWWYNLCLAQLIPNAWRAFVSFFSLIVHHRLESRMRVIHYFFQLKAPKDGTISSFVKGLAS